MNQQTRKYLNKDEKLMYLPKFNKMTPLFHHQVTHGFVLLSVIEERMSSHRRSEQVEEIHTVGYT